MSVLSAAAGAYTHLFTNLLRGGGLLFGLAGLGLAGLGLAGLGRCGDGSRLTRRRRRSAGRLPHTATGKLLKTELRDRYKDYRLPTA